MKFINVYIEYVYIRARRPMDRLCWPSTRHRPRRRLLGLCARLRLTWDRWRSARPPRHPHRPLRPRPLPPRPRRPLPRYHHPRRRHLARASAAGPPRFRRRAFVENGVVVVAVVVVDCDCGADCWGGVGGGGDCGWYCYVVVVGVDGGVEVERMNHREIFYFKTINLLITVSFRYI